MIGVYAGVSVKPEHVEEFLKTIEPLVTASRQDEGNVSYDFGAVSDTDFAFIERWESQELLEKHMGTFVCQPWRHTSLGGERGY